MMRYHWNGEAMKLCTLLQTAVAGAAALLLISGCAGPSTATKKGAQTARPADQAGAPKAGATKPAAPKGKAPLGPGEIRRAKLKSYQQRGVPYLLQRVPVRPAFRRGRFFGWRVLSYKGPGGAVVQAGDIINQVNGAPIEKPGQLFDVWSKMGRKAELVIKLTRRGQPTELRYRIVD